MTTFPGGVFLGSNHRECWTQVISCTLFQDALLKVSGKDRKGCTWGDTGERQSKVVVTRTNTALGSLYSTGSQMEKPTGSRVLKLST